MHSGLHWYQNLFSLYTAHMNGAVMNAYGRCTLCPHQCAVNRIDGEIGICGEAATVRVAWSGLHRGEEPPISSDRGSGMIFFCGCPLHCQYCQNYQISGVAALGSAVIGIDVTIDELASMMIGLEEMGAATINLVTGTHFIPSIIGAIEVARTKGLTLDIVWNSSGFERFEVLSLIDPYIDLYLIDLKTLDRGVGGRFCGSERYAEVVEPVMDFITERVAHTHIDEKGRLRGALIRHLVFPGELEASEAVLAFFSERLKKKAWLSLMVQFEPPRSDVSFEAIDEEAYQRLLDLLEALEIEDGFVQELGESVSWIPDFRRDNPFPPEFADPLPLFLSLRSSSNQ